MTRSDPASSASWTERLFRLSLWLYPIAFRRAHGEEMTRMFRDLERDARAEGRLGRFLLAALRDAFVGPIEARRRPIYQPPRHLAHREPFMSLFSTLFSSTLPLDLKLACRRLLRNPAFTLVAVFTLAIGIGANTAIFSAVYGVLLRPLPLDDPDRLVVLSLHRADLPSDVRGFFPHHVGLLQEQLEGRGFEGVTSYLWESVTLEGVGDGADATGGSTSGEAVEIGGAAMVDGAFFELLGAEPLRGRWLEERDQVPNQRGQSVVLSESLWTNRFGRDESIVGSKLVLDGHPVTVVGVAPDGVPLPRSGVSLWMPQSWDPYDRALWNRLSMMARLEPGTSSAQAAARLAAAADEMVKVHRRIEGHTISPTPFEESLVGQVRPALVALAVGVGLILLLACANLASLMLARVSRQRQDVATRRALGAHWSHLVSQQMAESLVLSLLGGGAGLGLAFGLHQALTTLGAPFLPRTADVRIDLPVLAFATAAAVFTGVVVGLVPALHAFAHDLASALRGVRSAGGGHRTRGVLVAVQVALAVSLAVGAGLMARTLAELSTVDTGFDPAGVGAARVYLDEESYGEDAQQREYLDTLLERLRQRSDIAFAGATSGLPFDPITMDYDLPYTLRGQEEDASRQAHYRIISPGYLEAMGIPLLQGRDFDRRDHAAAEQVALVNETMVRVAWGGDDPVGETFSIYGGRRTMKVVGVVGDLAFRGPSDSARPEFYVVHDQDPFSSMTVVVRSAAYEAGGDDAAAAAARAVAETALELNPRQPVHSAFTLADLRSQALAQPRFLTLLLVGFAVVSLLLAAAGIYGMLAGWIADSRRELGLRLALGADGGDIVALVLRRGLVATAIGGFVGLALARLGAAYLVPFLFGIGAGDLAVHLVAVLAAVVLSVAVSLLPAFAAGRIEPSKVLSAGRRGAGTGVGS